MPVKAAHCLVIDASVARAAGGDDATYPTSKQCRDLLRTVLTESYRVVLAQAIRDEWDRHQSGFARLWRLSMIARRKVCVLTVEENTQLRGKIDRTATNERDREALLKDYHLVEAALAADKIVISLDETVRDLLDRAALRVGELRIIVWANPCKDEDQCIAWLEEGAEPQKHRRLGFRPDHS